ncbi:hypothetical protein [Saccharothrix longispora]|uniref:hypothetical protein n=1 Tax=Saccharothrix longispora TaxID=33920 RepID=UPI0028FD1F00|nr:hypothetical protein [Saccharothrix longispora]MDU0294400.1 hypothetical protein [Saccharothrix longispora]
MGGSGRRGRRRQRSGPPGGGGTAYAAGRQAVRAQRSWFNRQGGGTQTLVVFGGIALLIGLHFLLWGEVIPAVGALVGRVPVLSTAVGWLYGGGAVMAWGVYAVNRATASPAVRKRLLTTAWAWTPVAVACFPSDYADSTVLPTDYWAGVYASAYGVVVVPLVAFVVALLSLPLVRLFPRLKDAGDGWLGWACVGYSVLLLVWASTLLRT